MNNRSTYTPSVSLMVGQFHQACDIHERTTPGWPGPEAIRLRLDLLREEFGEYRRAIATDDLPELADALADMVYIIYGTARVHGIDLDDVLAEVQRSNMAKVVDGKVIRRDDGKILKPEGWTPPDIRGVLADQGWDGQA